MSVRRAWILLVTSLSAFANFDTDFSVSDEEQVYQNDIKVEKKDYQNNNFKDSYEKGYVILLNKITTKSEKILLTKGKNIFWGNISLEIETCIRENYNSKMLLKVMEHKIDEDPKEVFYGWLLSESKSLYVLEHPVYEVFAFRCV